MAEIWDLIDIQKQRTGKFHERGKESLIPEGMYHLVVEIWVKNQNNEILLTQRHPNKNYGLLWECSGGSVLAGEDSISGAVRELSEETGIYASKEKLIYLGDTVKINYIVDTYLYTLENEKCELHLQPEEVVDAKFIKIDEISQMKDIIVNGVWDRYCQFRNRIETYEM